MKERLEALLTLLAILFYLTPFWLLLYALVNKLLK
jgi:hypothetical protein